MVQVFLVITLFSNASYLALISLSTAMILVPYLFSALYGLSLAWRGKGEKSSSSIKIGRGALLITALAAIYCLWLFYAAGLKYLLLSALLYAPGALIYMVAKRQRAKRVFNTWEWVILAVLVVLALVSAYLLATGRLGL
jgi:arginine:ornithine antiporter/lysine permease